MSGDIEIGDSRLLRVDAFRIYSMCTIIILHVEFFGIVESDSMTPLLRLISGIAVRFAIPYFSLMAGYFLAGNIDRRPSEVLSIALQYTARLGWVFVFWCTIYALIDPTKTLTLVKTHPLRILLEGTAVHLWYLPSLLMSLWLFVALGSNRHQKGFLLLGSVLFGLGLLGGPYKHTALGINLRIDPRNGPFFTTLFFGIGAAFHQLVPKLNRGWSAMIAVSGFALYCLEA
ncbi:MAG TPA: acyltransferase family protein, partial [Bacteroidota bacterium]